MKRVYIILIIACCLISGSTEGRLASTRFRSHVHSSPHAGNDYVFAPRLYDHIEMFYWR